MKEELMDVKYDKYKNIQSHGYYLLLHHRNGLLSSTKKEKHEKDQNEHNMEMFPFLFFFLMETTGLLSNVLNLNTMWMWALWRTDLRSV